MKGIEVDE